jgi:hypothetical protein
MEKKSYLVEGNKIVGMAAHKVQILECFVHVMG